MKMKEILNYQKKDFEIIKLERSLNESPNRKIISQILKIVKDSQNLSLSLEAEAAEIILQFGNLKKLYSDNIESFMALSHQETESLDEDEAAEIIKRTNSMVANLAVLEKKLLVMAEKVNTILSNYELAKKKYQSAKVHYKSASEKFNTEKKELSPQIAKLSKELKSLEKNIESKVLKLYKEKRQDKVFPIFVELISSSCGGCRMQLASAQIQKLKKEEVLECENCHRYIFLNQLKDEK